MSKEVEELRNRFQQIALDLRDINAAAEAEKRYELTADEEKKYKELAAEAQAVRRALEVYAMQETPETRAQAQDALNRGCYELPITSQRNAAGELLRQLFSTSNARAKSEVKIELRDAGVAVTAADVPGIVPITIGDIIEPLEKGLLLGQLGEKILTGLSGDYKYPVIPYVEATIGKEAVEIEDTTFDIDSLSPNPQRVAISVPVSNWAMTQSNMVLYNTVVNAVSLGIRRLLNRWMLQPSKIVDGVFGPMAYDAGKNAVIQKAFAGAVPTFAELLGMVGAVESSGAYNDGTFAFVMSAKMAAILRATPRGNGDKMIIEDNKIDIYPVFLSEEIEALGDGTYNATPKHVGFGRWSDLKVGQFGEMRLIGDPYSRSKEDVTVITMNGYFSEDVIRKGSFVIGTVTV